MFAPEERKFHRSESSKERMFHRTIVPREQKFHGNESSLNGLFAPGNESAEERKAQHSPIIYVQLQFAFLQTQKPATQLKLT